MPRPTLHDPDRGDARTRLLEAARDVIRARGFAATSVDELCRAAGVAKGAFFHHFPTKAALGEAAARHWARTTDAFFATAPYHAPADPLDRLLGYVAFRRAIIEGEVPAFSCLAGTLVQEVHRDWPAIREAAGGAILDHAATLEADIAAAMARAGIEAGWTAASLARHVQGTLQGAFILAKAGDDPALARESVDHLDRYLRLLFGRPLPEGPR